MQGARGHRIAGTFFADQADEKASKDVNLLFKIKWLKISTSGHPAD